LDDHELAVAEACDMGDAGGALDAGEEGWGIREGWGAECEGIAEGRK
jgi:hypothetical protein